MSYPERGAGYRHTPKFIDRMKAEEGKSSTPFKRAEGGNVDDEPFVQGGHYEPRAERGGVDFDAEDGVPARIADEVSQIKRVQADMGLRNKVGLTPADQGPGALRRGMRTKAKTMIDDGNEED